VHMLRDGIEIDTALFDFSVAYYLEDKLAYW
jgi:hypothetical protein